MHAFHPFRLARFPAFAFASLLAAATAVAGVPLLAPAYLPRDDTPPGYLEEGGEARGLAVAAERGIDLDIDDVRAAQDAALAEQARDDGGAAWFDPASTPLLATLDTIHDNTFRLLDNLVRTLDLSWAIPGVDYDVELSSLSLAPMIRVGGRGNDGDFKFRLRLRADTALPGIERRFHLVVDNAGRDYLPGTDPMAREADWRLGIRSAWDTWTGAEFDIGGGLRFRASELVGFAESSLLWEWPVVGGDLRLVPSVFYYTDTHWGHDVRVAWLRWFGPGDRWGVELSSAEKHSEHSAAFDLEHTVKLAWAQSDRKNRGFVFQASLFPTVPDHHPELLIDDSTLALSWKSAVYRRWLYATLTPQIDFAREDRHDARFSFRAGFEILFGGETRRLL